MPVTLKTGVMKYRKSDGTYSVMDALMQEPAQDQIDAIETAGQNILNGLPEDYTELETDIGELKVALIHLRTWRTMPQRYDRRIKHEQHH